MAITNLIARQGFYEEIMNALMEADISIFGSAVIMDYRTKYFKKQFDFHGEEDVSVLAPTLAGRFDIAGDIDCFHHGDNTDVIIAVFKKLGLYVARTKYTTNNYKRFPAWLPPNFRLVTYTVRPGMSSECVRNMVGTTFDVNIDFMYALGDRDKDPSTVLELDFRCNGLIMDKHGYRVAAAFNCTTAFDRQETLNTILKEIVDNKAIKYMVLDNKTAADKKFQARVKKMVKKGFIVTDYTCDMVEPCTCAKDKNHLDTCFHSDLCTICLDDLNQDCIKMKCCKASYHSKCYMKMRGSKVTVCPVCRNEDVIWT